MPAGKTARMRVYQEGRSFTVTKQVYNTTKCAFVTKSTTTMRAPTSST